MVSGERFQRSYLRKARSRSGISAKAIREVINGDIKGRSRDKISE